MIPDDDHEFRESCIKTVNPYDDATGWEIIDIDGWAFFCPVGDYEPKVGDLVRFYGKGIGYSVRGLSINGHEIFYRTAEQDEDAHRQRRKAEEVKRQKELEESLPERDAAYDALPEVFRLRIDKFRQANPNFRRDYEPYEVFTCQQAVLIADTLKSAEKVQEFFISTPNAQTVMVPNLSEDHSGNTFGMACRLAYVYLSDPVGVEVEHGALTGLTGCEGYGCPHPYDPKTKSLKEIQ